MCSSDLTLNGAVESNSGYPGTKDSWTDRGHGTSTFYFSASNRPPTVGLTAPGDGTPFAVNATVILTASAADSDGTISKVDFFVDNINVGEDTTPPYSCNWVMNALGGHSVFARATDNSSAVVDTSAITVTGHSAPTLAFQRGVNGLTFSWSETGFKLQAQTNSAELTTNWFDYPSGGTSPVTVPIDPANPSVYFRLKDGLTIGDLLRSYFPVVFYESLGHDL